MKKKLLLLCATIIIPAAAHAQNRVVCQTPRFWCVFFVPIVLPNGTPCHCGTPAGQVMGYSIVPTGVPAPAMTFPPLQPVPSQPQIPQPNPNRSTTATTDDCYKGLGNCGDAYSSQ